MSTESIYCHTGEHWWDRKVCRGRKPTSCPKHLVAGARVTGAADPDSEDAPIFAEEELAQDAALRASGVEDPSFKDLKRILEKNGPDGIIESARHLPPQQYNRLADMVKRTPARRKGRFA